MHIFATADGLPALFEPDLIHTKNQRSKVYVCLLGQMVRRELR